MKPSVVELRVSLQHNMYNIHEIKNVNINTASIRHIYYISALCFFCLGALVSVLVAVLFYVNFFKSYLSTQVVQNT